MEMFDLQQEVSEFVKKNNFEADVEARLLDLTSELGELAKEVLKGSDYGKKEFVVSENWENELGDVLFALICVANKTEVDLESALNSALAKYERRHEEKGEIGSGS